MGEEILSNTLKNEVVPYCISNNLIETPKNIESRKEERDGRD